MSKKQCKTPCLCDTCTKERDVAFNNGLTQGKSIGEIGCIKQTAKVIQDAKNEVLEEAIKIMKDSFFGFEHYEDAKIRLTSLKS